MKRRSSQYFFSGQSSKHEAGVGMLLSKRAQQYNIGYNPISERIMSARLRAQPIDISVIQIYAPTADSSDEEVEAYLQLQECLDRCSSQDVKFIVGDWNAKVGIDQRNWEQQMGKFGYGECNERGERLLEFATLNNLYICSTKPSRKWTKKRITQMEET